MTTTTTDRNGLEILGFSECLELLARAPVGRIAYVEGGQPVVLPVNHVVLGSKVAFRTAEGGKLDAAVMGRQVAFEVDSYDRHTRTGWSVVVRGEAGTVEEPGLLSWLEAQDLRPWADQRTRPTWVVIRADDVSGRRTARPTTRLPERSDQRSSCT